MDSTYPTGSLKIQVSDIIQDNCLGFVFVHGVENLFNIKHTMLGSCIILWIRYVVWHLLFFRYNCDVRPVPFRLLIIDFTIIFGRKKMVL